MPRSPTDASGSERQTQSKEPARDGLAVVAAIPAPAPEVSPVPRKRHGSQTRQRTKAVAVPCTPEEYATLIAKAAASGVSAGGYLRAGGLGATTPRTKRQAPPDRALYAEAIRALNRTGNNLNQLARALNRGDMMIPDDLHAVLRGYGQALNVLMHAATGTAHDP